MTPYDRHLRAARGFLELGLPLDANEELEQIEPEMRTLSEVLVVRMVIYEQLGKWELAEAVAARMCVLREDEPEWQMRLADAARRAHSLKRGVAVLTAAASRFSAFAPIHYHLACFEAQLNHLPAARKHLQEAIQLDPGYRRLAQEDDDLQSLREEL